MTTTTPPPPAPASESPAPWFTSQGSAITGSELGAALVAGVFGNLALRTNPATYAGAATFVLIGFALLVSRRLQRTDSIVVLAAALLLAPWLALRDDPLLGALNVLTILMLLGLTGLFDTRRSLFDFGVGDAVIGAFAWVGESLAAFPFVAPVARRLGSGVRVAPVVRGAVLAAPVVLILGALLASADDVFASLFAVDADLPNWLGHIVAIATCMWVAIMFVSHASGHDRPTTPDPPQLGATEALVVLASVNVLFLTFVVTRIVTALGGADHILRTEGLTAAEYARSGFFQLLWVAGLVIALLSALSALTNRSPARDRRRFVGLSLITVVLTLIIDAIAIQRLYLYIDAFHLTRLRFWTFAFTIWVGVVLAMVGVHLSGWRADQRWLLGGAISAWFVFLLAMNAVAPDAAIARFNLNQDAALEQTDVSYLIRTLSDDAVPALVEAVEQNSVASTGRLTRQLCQTFDERHAYGLIGSNRSRTKADKLLDDLCGPRDAPPEPQVRLGGSD